MSGEGVIRLPRLRGGGSDRVDPKRHVNGGHRIYGIYPPPEKLEEKDRVSPVLWYFAGGRNGKQKPPTIGQLREGRRAEKTSRKSFGLLGSLFGFSYSTSARRTTKTAESKPAETQGHNTSTRTGAAADAAEAAPALDNEDGADVQEVEENSNEAQVVMSGGLGSW
ncbi:hypothetical protein LTR66_002379 [Elasticomyces elasticus]|nr:hypothetical protein LTR66_002379 [Elasticomyces elasticus]